MRKGKRMIYLKNSTASQKVQIARNGCDLTGSMVFILRSTMLDANGELEIGVADDGLSASYFSFECIVNDMVEGEYEYTLTQNGKALAKGLLVIGEPSETIEYNKAIEYEQYN